MNIHHLADVKSANVGKGTVIWQYAVVLEGAIIGENCNINCHTFIENDVIIGNNVTVKSGVFIWDGMTIEDDVFIGPNATFTNDKYPRSKQYPDSFQRLRLEQGCSIGAGAIVLGGISVGAYSIIGAGSVVTKDVPPHALVTGSPATLKGWLDEKGVKLIEKEPGQLEDGDGGRYIINDGQLVKL